MSDTASFRSRTTGRAGCRRLNARSCRTSAVARSAAPRMSSTNSGAGSSSGFMATSSALPRITVRRLLKSWAMPPARRPRLYIFWAWRTWACRSV